MYEFWVSATTGLGEGEPTTIVTQTTNTRGLIIHRIIFLHFFNLWIIFINLIKFLLYKAPARVASFSQLLRRAIKSSITLSCLVVGNPTPRPIWTYRNSQISTGRHYELTADGHLNIRG